MDRNEVFEQLRTNASEVLRVEPARITEQARFGDDLQADSLDLVELVMALEERYDVRIPEEELEGIVTVGDALDLLLDKLSART
jgi:acyl carrier protein